MEESRLEEQGGIYSHIFSSLLLKNYSEELFGASLVVFGELEGKEVGWQELVG